MKSTVALLHLALLAPLSLACFALVPGSQRRHVLSPPAAHMDAEPAMTMADIAIRKKPPKTSRKVRSAKGDVNWTSDTEERASSSTLRTSAREQLARAAAALMAQREEEDRRTPAKHPTFSSLSAAAKIKKNSNAYRGYMFVEDDSEESSHDLIELTKKIDQKIMNNNWSRSGQRKRVNDKIYNGRHGHTKHSTDSIQSLIGYNHFEGDWSDKNITVCHVAIVFGKPLIQDQVTREYATRLQTLVKLLKEEPSFAPRLICFTGGSCATTVATSRSSISNAHAGYVYFRHLCASQNVTINDQTTKLWVDSKNTNEREAMERIASELWRNHLQLWLAERPLLERMNQHYGVGWKILERKLDIHFTLVSTEYHLCNLNDIHHRSPLKSFLQPLVSLKGLVGSDRWKNNHQQLEVMDPNYSMSVHVRGSSSGSSGSSRVSPGGESDKRVTFGGIENSVDTSWSFHYGTYPYLHETDESIAFLGQCYLLGEELMPLLVNLKGVVEQTEFFQRDNYYLLSSIRRTLVSLIEALYTEKGESIRSGVILHFERLGRSNPLTKGDVKIIAILESALLNLGRCIDMVKPAGLLVSSVPASTWSKALDALEKSMSHIQTVCDPDQPLDPMEWGKLNLEEENAL